MRLDCKVTCVSLTEMSSSSNELSSMLRENIYV